MSDSSGSDVGAATPADGWAAEQGALLRGIAHALSNRVGTVVSAVGMLTPGAPVAAPIVAVLVDEGARLEALLEQVRLLAGDGEGRGPEPVHVPDLVRPVVALHAHHPDGRDVECEIDDAPIEVPALVAPDAAARALLVLLTAIKRGAESSVRVAWSELPHAVALDVRGAPGDDAAAAAAAALLDGGGARVRAEADGYRVELPRFGAARSSASICGSTSLV